MIKRALRDPKAIVAALCVAAGIVSTFHAARRTPGQMERIRTRTARLDQLNRIALEQEAPNALLRALEREDSTSPEDPRGLLDEILQDDAFELTEEEPIAIQQGWVLRTVRVTMGDVRLDRLGDLMARLENGRPPWRVTACTIVPGPVSGKGRVTLAVEALSRASSP